MARNFTNFLRAYMDWTRISESPDQFHLWTAVGTVAGALRSCVWIDQKTYKYTPNFFLFFVGPPGIAAKSTSIGLGMRLLEQVPDVKFGPPSMTWQYMAKAMKDAAITIDWIDENGVAQQRAASPITIEASELGTFLKLSQEGLTEVLIDLWDGKVSKRAWGHGTAMSGMLSVQNPWIHILGATTPAWLTEHFPAQMIYGGLTSRILFIYGDYKRQLVAYPAQLPAAADFEEVEIKLVEDLISISKLRGPMTLTPEAYTWGAEWYRDLWTNIPSHLMGARFEGYRSRKQPMLHKLAMVLSAAQREDKVIDVKIMMEADELMTSAETTMLKVFNSIGMVAESQQVRELVSLVLAYMPVYPQGMSSNALYKLVSSTMTVRDFDAAMQSAVRSGSLTMVVLGFDLTTGAKLYGVKLGKTGPTTPPPSANTTPGATV